MLQASLRGGVAGAVATVVMTLEQPLDQRLFDSEHDDVEILGKLFTRGDYWRPIGFTLHVQNGASRVSLAALGDLGAAYARLKPSLPGSAVLPGLLAALIEHIAAWPLTVVFDRYHPAREELPKLATSPRAFGQATIRHALFGIVLGIVEDALNDRSAELTKQLASSLSCACQARFPRTHGSPLTCARIDRFGKHQHTHHLDQPSDDRHRHDLRSGRPAAPHAGADPGSPRRPAGGLRPSGRTSGRRPA